MLAKPAKHGMQHAACKQHACIVHGFLLLQVSQTPIHSGTTHPKGFAAGSFKLLHAEGLLCAEQPTQPAT
jgi:hypothetical protein